MSNGHFPWTRYGLLFLAYAAVGGILLVPLDRDARLQLVAIATAAIAAVAGMSLPRKD